MILLDTHVLVWSQFDERKLSRRAFSTLRRARNAGGLAISAISLVEIANMIERGKIETHGTIDGTISRCSEDIVVVPITREIASLTIRFPPDFPRDPMDRIIAATARAEGLLLVTADEGILRCPLLRTVW